MFSKKICVIEKYVLTLRRFLETDFNKIGVYIKVMLKMIDRIERTCNSTVSGKFLSDKLDNSTILLSAKRERERERGRAVFLRA
jgi:hypothetical protein